MTGYELIQLLITSPSIGGIINAISGAIIGALFLRSNTSKREFEKIKSGRLNEVVEDLLASGEMTYTEFYNAKNYLEIAQKADEKIASEQVDEEKHGNESFSFDWFVRFYKAAGNISNEEMQSIWASILSGEVSCPGTYSLRTIDILRNISRREAELFTDICSHCICAGERLFLPHYPSYLEKNDIKYSDLLLLDEIGLISSNGLLSSDVMIPGNETAIFLPSETLVMEVQSINGTQQKLTVYEYPLTHVGCEIATAIGFKTNQEDYLTFARCLEENSGFKIKVYRIVSHNATQIEYDEREDFLTNSNAKILNKEYTTWGNDELGEISIDLEPLSSDEIDEIIK